MGGLLGLMRHAELGKVVLLSGRTAEPNEAIESFSKAVNGVDGSGLTCWHRLSSKLGGRS